MLCTKIFWGEMQLQMDILGSRFGVACFALLITAQAHLKSLYKSAVQRWSLNRSFCGTGWNTTKAMAISKVIVLYLINSDNIFV